MSIIEKIRKMVAKDNLDTAIEEVIKLLQPRGGELYEEAIRLQQNWSSTSKKIRRNLLSDSEARVAVANVTFPLLEMLTTLEKSANVATKILFLAANPVNTSRLRLDEEIREIETGLRLSNERDRFQLVQKWAVTTKSLQQALLDESPNIVHFSGHGSANNLDVPGDNSRFIARKKENPEPEDENEGGLALEDNSGNMRLINADLLSGLFSLFSDSINCIFLNACYSEKQANALIKHIPYVVGMEKAVHDQTAIHFAVGFYKALGAGKDYEFAFKMGKESIRLAGLPGENTPKLLKRDS